MAKRWTKQEADLRRSELERLYIKENRTISQIGSILDISYKTIYDRLIRLNIPRAPEKKSSYLNIREDIKIPIHYSDEIAEFFGVMLDDRNLSHFQVAVTLGNKEENYSEYISLLIKHIFHAKPKIAISSKGNYRTVYLSSVIASQWLQSEGLVFNKVRSQIDMPKWIFSQDSYMEKCARGFFDTDGSVYRLKYGVQISFTNHSKPLLFSLQRLLRQLGYRVSEITGHRFYITRDYDLRRFLNEIQPHNQKHLERFKTFLNIS